MPEITEIIHAVSKINSQTASIRTHVDKISAMPGEALSAFDATVLSVNLEIAADALKTVLEMAAYLSRPVVETSRLWRNGSGQYETTRGYCFCEGSTIEVLIPDQYNPDNAHWERTRLQYDGRDYCLAEYPDLHLAGLPVRIRIGDKP